jgi:hypothetical protein
MEKDSLRVVSVALGTTGLMEFLDGGAKLVTWLLGSVYILVQIIKVWNELKNVRNKT